MVVPIENYVPVVKYYGLNTEKSTNLGGPVTFSQIPFVINLPPDSSPGIPNLGPYGFVLGFKGADGTYQSKFNADLDGDGDVDADFWRKDKGYNVYELEVHDRFMEEGQAERGRLVRTADTNGNWMLSALNYSGSTDKHLYLGKYNGPGVAYTPWQKFDKANGNVIIGGATSDTPAARLHIKDTGATVAFLETSNSTSRITFRASGSSSNTGVGIGAIADDLIMRAGATNIAKFTSTTLDMQSHKVVNVTDPTSAQDAATKNYVDTGGWVSVPASASATGTAGQKAYDSSYLYICTATDTWRRVAHSTW